MQFGQLKRREFISLLGAVTASIPLVGRAQQRGPVIGFLHQGSPEPLHNTNAFKKGLSEAGIDSQTVTIEDRAANGHYDRLPALAAELVVDQVAVIAANFLPAALAAKAATQTVPIVFLSGSDPIKSGLVSSINRPSGNVTGIAPMFTLLGTKNLELLHELVPTVTVTDNLPLVAAGKDNKLPTEDARRCLQVSQLMLCVRIGQIRKRPRSRAHGENLRSDAPCPR